MQVVGEGHYVLWMLERIFSDMPNVTEGLNKLFAEVTHAHGSGKISERAASRLHQEIHDRRQRQAKGSDARSRPGFHIAPMLRALKRNADSAPENLTPEAALHAAELARRSRRLILRRWLASVASIPADILQHFTTAGQSVLSFVALKCRYGDRCDLPVNSIANIAQVSERTVQSTIRQAERMGLVEVQYRKRLPNVVRVVSQVWLDWWARSHSHTESQKCLFSFSKIDPLLGAKTVRDTPVPTGKLSSDAAPAETADVAVLEALVPAPKRVVPVVPKPRPKLVVETVDDHLDAAKALVEKVARTRPADVSDADEWELPEPKQWMTPGDRTWLAGFEVVEPLYRFSAKVMTQRGAVHEDVLNWLGKKWGAAGNLYSFRSFKPLDLIDRDLRIGFKYRTMLEAFRNEWGKA